ncbi:AAA family ATPase [Purpureocillium lavendulum]|uniref:AAA family ATPase n=1 Tax=Purpureocillium lavendulum TaxID=1247861 RepID=A0AB34FP47_9HYPO|nr:AAA family ATPase [Purpureocillium lavendulum]
MKNSNGEILPILETDKLVNVRASILTGMATRLDSLERAVSTGSDRMGQVVTALDGLKASLKELFKSFVSQLLGGDDDVAMAPVKMEWSPHKAHIATLKQQAAELQQQKAALPRTLRQSQEHNAALQRQIAAYRRYEKQDQGLAQVISTIVI